MKDVLLKIVGVLLLLTLYIVYKVNQKFPVDSSVEIKKYVSTFRIGEILKEKQVIDSSYIFFLYSKLKGNNLKAGYYEFKGELSISDVYQIMREGLVKEYIFTIIPGDNLFIIGDKLQREGILKKEEFLNFTLNSENVKRYGLEGENFEGYFPPETYRILLKAGVEDVVEIFLREFRKKYLPYKEKFSNNINFYQGMIIASMIEKEAFLEEEKPKIAGVILNRLEKDMRLQIDPTVIYALIIQNSYTGKLRRKDLTVHSPYNTYRNKGLPPTPICSFTLNSLEAVLNPQKHDYLYYVLSKDKKSHVFSQNYETHLKNIKENLKD